MSSNTTKSGVALFLTFAAGFVDIVGFLTLLNVFTAHMTGDTVHAANDLIQGNVARALTGLTVIAAFLGGSILGRVLIGAAARHHVRRAASITLALEAALIGVVIILAPRGPGPNLPMLVSLAAAMGLQTASLTRVGPLTVHTTFVTGMLNKLAQLISHVLFLSYDTLRGRPVHHLRARTVRETGFIFSIWILYFAGAAAGTRMVLSTGLYCLFVPIVIVTGAIFVDQLQPLSLQEEKDELDQSV